MKEKIIKISLFVVIFLLSSVISFSNIEATSGACSWHGGVNCAAGADWDGSVICNDGWRDSSVSFYSTDECYQEALCTSSELEFLLTKYGVIEKINEFTEQNTKIISLQNKITQLEIDRQKEIDNAYNRLAPMSSIEAEVREINRIYDSQKATLIIQLQAEINLASILEGEIDFAKSQVDIECKVLGYDRQQQEIIDRIKEQEKFLEELQASSCPANSYYSDGKCFCNEGYIASGNICITYTQSCQNQYGVNSYGDKNHCYCNTGYEWNSTKTACIQSVICPLNSTKINNICICNKGYQWNSSQTACIKIETSEKKEEPENITQEEKQTEQDQQKEQEFSQQNENEENEDSGNVLGFETQINNEVQEEINEEVEEQEQEVSISTVLASISSILETIFNTIKNFLYSIFHLFSQ